METFQNSVVSWAKKKSHNDHLFPIFNRQAMSFADKSMSEVVWCLSRMWNYSWRTQIKVNLLVRSFYPNLVKDRTAPASADADPGARASHAVRQPIQAFHQPLNKLTDDAIIQAHREKTARLGLEKREESRRKTNTLNCFFQQLLPSGRTGTICVELEDDFPSEFCNADGKTISQKTREGFSKDNLSFKSNECGGIATSTSLKVCIAVTVKCSRNVCFELVDKNLVN